MDIRDARGHVGDYHNLEVHVYPRKEFNQLRRTDREIIYVLTEKGKYESLMVHDGRVIGHIDPQGGVTEYDNPFDYMKGADKPAKKQVEKEVAKREEKKAAPKAKPQTVSSPSFGTDVEGYLRWVTEDWDPISEAMRLVDLSVDMSNIDLDALAVG